jgi:hypothetical protein
MRYAIGEVILIMLGIFMALQLQNWNEKRKQEAQFKTTLDQLYTNITYESQNFQGDSVWFKVHTDWLSELLYNPDTIPDSDLPIRLHYIAFWNGDPLVSESVYYSQNLNYDPNDPEQVGLAKEIFTYINKISNHEYHVDDRMEKDISDVDIEIPIADVDTYNDEAYPLDTLVYDPIDIENLRTWIHSSKSRGILKKVKVYKNWNYLEALNLLEDGRSIKKLIKNYYPDVKLLYTDVGIIGSAINGWDESTPMYFNQKENIWEIDLYLNLGEIKFRCRDSWTQNWGNSKATFPAGFGFQDGGNIPIPESGNYHVIFKPETGEYEFIKQDD